MGNPNTQDSSRPGLEGSHHLHPYSIFCASPRGPHPNGFLSLDSQVGVPKFHQHGLPQFWRHITSCADLQSQWGLKQSYSPHQELSNGMSHAAYTQGNRVDSRLLVVRNQITSLTFSPSFAHNSCCRCSNGSCEAIFDNIYTSKPFQRYKKHVKARCFDPCNRVLNFQESQRTPKSPFRECECHPHIPSKWGCDNLEGH
jgi:hypothetical protein